VYREAGHALAVDRQRPGGVERQALEDGVARLPVAVREALHHPSEHEVERIRQRPLEVSGVARGDLAPERVELVAFGSLLHHGGGSR
jgi:hypothetical protein